MKNTLFTGTCTALVTPFENGKINDSMLKTLLKRQIDAKIPAVVLSGTTGESPTLADDEKLHLFQVAKEYVGDSCLVIAGTGSNDTKHAVQLSEAAQDAGVDALLIVSPYYNKATPEGLFLHYRTIANAVDIPIIVYNVPSRTGVDIPVSVYDRLSQIPNIAGVKEASTDLGKILKIRSQLGDAFPVWSGNDDLTVPIMSLGGSGVISVISNVCPEEMVKLTDAAQSGNYQTAAELQGKLHSLTELMFCEVNPIPVKAAMKYIGFDCGDCRLPLCPLSKVHLQKIQNYFQ